LHRTANGVGAAGNDGRIVDRERDLRRAGPLPLAEAGGGEQED
jgi:hypothetical protein